MRYLRPLSYYVHKNVVWDNITRFVGYSVILLVNSRYLTVIPIRESILSGRISHYVSISVVGAELVAIIFLILSFKETLLVLYSAFYWAKRNSAVTTVMVLSVLMTICLSPIPLIASIFYIRISLLVLYFAVSRRVLIESTLYVWFLTGVFINGTLAVFQSILGHSVGGIATLLHENHYTLFTPQIAKTVVCMFFSCFTYVRPYGLFPHPNILGGYALFGILILLRVVGKIPKKTVYYYVWILSIVLFSTTIILTLSRSTLFVALLMFLFYSKIYMFRVWSWYAIGMVVFMVVLFLLRVETREFIQEGIVPTSLNERVDGIYMAFEMWKHSPFIGSGIGSYLHSASTTFHQGGITQPVHVIYLLLLSESGMLGIVFMVAAAIALWKRHVHILRYTPLISLLFIGFFDHYPLTLPHGQWLLVYSLFCIFPPFPSKLES